MEQGHVTMYRKLLESIERYSQKILDLFQRGAGDLPQWTNDLISESRTHLADVTHFVRGRASDGIRYGQANHGRAYMATANIRQINEYAKECLNLFQPGSGHYPSWIENKISIVAEYMDLIGHWLENEAIEGRVYGTHLTPVPGDAGDAALYRGRADGLVGEHRNPYSPNDFRRKIYEQGFSEGYDRISSGMDWVSWRKSQRDSPSFIVEPGVKNSSRGLRRFSGSGQPTPGNRQIPRAILTEASSSDHPAGHAGKPGIVYQPGYGSMMALGAPPTAPVTIVMMEPSQMEYTMPPNRMLEPTRMGEQSRMLWHQTGRRFGVPGIPAGQPGWAGNAGVAQIPHPSRGMTRAPDRSFGPGLSAGQGGVQTFRSGGGPIAVQTYGSLGYASMGDGSMDMAVRGARFSGRGVTQGDKLSGSIKQKIGPRAARRSRRGKRK